MMWCSFLDCRPPFKAKNFSEMVRHVVVVHGEETPHALVAAWTRQDKNLGEYVPASVVEERQ